MGLCIGCLVVPEVAEVARLTIPAAICMIDEAARLTSAVFCRCSDNSFENLCWTRTHKAFHVYLWNDDLVSPDHWPLIARLAVIIPRKGFSSPRKLYAPCLVPSRFDESNTLLTTSSLQAIQYCSSYGTARVFLELAS